MTISFYKYQGTGNDFVIMDNRDGRYSELNKEQIRFLCDRRFGVGADGLMLLNTHPHLDFEMKYYNADGGESSMCGNGGRCLVMFAHHCGIIRQLYHFVAIDGEHEAEIRENNTVALKMNDVNEIKEASNYFVLNTGSPHFVQMVDDVMRMDVFAKGRDIRNSKAFKSEGINVNFVEHGKKKNNIIVRTYERGVEDETYSCGTGVTAAALVNYHNEKGFNQVNVTTKGGPLSVEYEKYGNSYQNIWLIGPAVKVFEGTLLMPA